MLALNADNTAVVADSSIVDLARTPQKLFSVNTLKCTSDLVACGLANGTVQVYQVTLGGKNRLAYKLQDHKRVVNSLDFVDDSVLVSGSQDGTVKVWDLRTFSPRPVMQLAASHHSDPVRSCQASAHCRVRGKTTVLSVHDSGALCKFDLRATAGVGAGVGAGAGAGALLPERKWTFHSGPALSLHIHPDAEYVLTGGRDRKICVWHYGEAGLHSVAPLLIVNTYGPVMKVRWCTVAAQDPVEPTLDLPDAPDPLCLYNYDFACLYLNDDATISVYNLRRRYIPKAVVASPMRKPVQNFVWAALRTDRRLFSISKANVLVAHDLDVNDVDITRPLDNMPAVATAWRPGYANVSIVSQHKNDFELGDPVADSRDTSFDDTRDDLLHLRSTPPKERPPIVRQSTQFTVALLKSQSPVLHQRGMDSSVRDSSARAMDLSGRGLDLPPPVRPSLPRNPSQSTQGSQSLGAAHSKSLPHAPSPYVAALSVPIPLADDTVFDILAAEYHISVPDGFSLLDVCQMNARVAASVSRYRDCEIWRMLGVLLEQEFEEHQFDDPRFDGQFEDQHTDPQNASGSQHSEKDIDTKSVSSYLGNFVGSFNSNSTLTTNYGGPHRSDSATSMNKALFGSKEREGKEGKDIKHGKREKEIEQGLESPKELNPLSTRRKDLDSKANNADSSALDKPGDKSLDRSALDRSAPTLFRNKLLLQTSDGETPKDNNLSDEIHAYEPRNNLSTKVSLSTMSSQKLKAIDIKAPRRYSNNAMLASMSPEIFASSESPLKHIAKLSPSRSQTGHSWSIPLSSHDLDDENMPASVSGSLASSGYMGGPDSRSGITGTSFHSNPRSHPSFLSHRSSLTSGRSSFVTNRSGFYSLQVQPAPQLLEKVEEFSISSAEPKTSELTKAMRKKKFSYEELESSEANEKPWSLINLLEKAVIYARDQGDLVMCCTLILLFHDLFKKIFSNRILSDNACLECLALYVDTLRGKCLFTTAVNVVKEAPSSLNYKLAVYASKDVDMRYYCCWCEKLLVNETSKAKFGPNSENFGYWYCDSCSRRQLNCIYCGEPCRGLTVVVSLNCGHRGHFGCLQEWFLDEQSTGCPGGCEYVMD